MPIINKGTSFSNGEQLTADKINNLLDLAEFNQSATDSASTTVNSASQIVVADSGVTTAKLATDAVETAKIKDANVTTAKIADANVTFAKLTDVIDDDTMATATDTTLATSESIKAYVDGRFTPSTYAGGESVTLPNGLIMKFGIETGLVNGSNTITFGSAFPNSCLNIQMCRQKSTYVIYEDNELVLGVPSTTSFKSYIANATVYGNLYWQAIGY